MRPYPVSLPGFQVLQVPWEKHGKTTAATSIGPGELRVTGCNTNADTKRCICSVFLPNKSHYGGVSQMGKLRHRSGLGKWRGSAAELEAESPDTCLGQGDLHVHPEISHPRYPLCTCESTTCEATAVPACISVSPSPPSPVSLSLPKSRCFSLPDHAKIPATPSPPPASRCYRHPLHEETHVPSPRHARCPRALLCPAVPAAMPSGHGRLATHNKAVFLSMLCCSRFLCGSGARAGCGQ